MTTPTDPFALTQWRHAVAGLYGHVREASNANGAATAEHFRRGRDALFKTHPSSPLSLEQRAAFEGLDYYPFNPAYSVLGTLDRAVEHQSEETDLAADGVLRYTRVAQAHFELGGEVGMLNAYWLEGYGGGLFLPFRDCTNGETTYGGGRFLYDTIKGADLGVTDEQVVLDFNYAYNPSCAYADRWVCPLIPEENRLELAVEAGERVL
ncbi:MAG: DUF1684 domain-containing protein [Acidiferrobacterales bacterium]